MTNQEMRKIVEQNDINLFKINYKTGVHYGVIEDFFGGKTDDLSAKDRERIENMLAAEVKKIEKASCSCDGGCDSKCPCCDKKKLAIAGCAVALLAAVVICKRK